MNFENNFIYAGLSLAFKAVNNLILITILSRFIGLGNFGFLNYMITLVALIATVVDYGYRGYIIKEVSIRKGEIGFSFLANKILLKLIIFLLAIMSLTFYLTYFEKFTAPPVWTVILFCCSALFIDLSYFFFAIFQGKKNFKLELVGLFSFSFILLIGFFLTVYLGRVRYFTASYFIGSLVMIIVTWLLFSSIYKLRILKIFKHFSISQVVSESKCLVPFAIVSIGDIAFSTVDILFVQTFTSVNDLGVYFGCLKIVLVFSVISTLTYTLLMPDFSRIVMKSNKEIKESINKVFIVQISIVFLLCSFFFFFSDSIISVMFGPDFCNNSLFDIAMFKIQILLLIAARYLVVVPAVYLLVSNHHWKRAKLLLIVLIVTIIMHYVLIPKNGISAAINVTVIAYLVLFVLYTCVMYYLISKERKQKIILF